MNSLPARTIWAAGIVASAAVVAVVLASPYLATHDGPQHLYLAHISTHFSDPGAPYADFYQPTTSLTARGFSLLYGPLSELLPWRSALKVTLSVILLLWSWGFMLLVHSVRRERLGLGLLGFALAFQWSLFMGFFSYLLSVAIGLITVAVAVRTASWSSRQRLLISGLLLLQAISHVFGAEVVGLFLVVLVLVRSERAALGREIVLLLLMGSPVLLIAVHATGWLSGSGPLPRSGALETWPLFERLRLMGGLFVGGPAWRSLPALALALLGLAFALGRWRAGVATKEERALFVTASLLFCTAVLAPIHLPTWEYFSPRFLAPAVMLALPLLPVEVLSHRSRSVSIAAIAGFTLFAIGWAGRFNRDVYRRCADAFEGALQPLRRSGFRLPVLLDSSCGHHQAARDADFPFFAPAGNLGPLYSIAQGGLVPYTFALRPELHGFVIRDDAKSRLLPAPKRALYYWAYEDPATRLAPKERLLMTTQIASDAARFEDVILYGPETDRTLFAERGFVSDWSRGQMAILRFEGCPASLALESDAPLQRPVKLEYAWYPADRFFALPSLAPEMFTDGRRKVIPLTGMPCGSVLLRVFVDDDGSGAFSKGDRRCHGTREHGVALANLGPAKPELRCVLGPPG